MDLTFLTKDILKPLLIQKENMILEQLSDLVKKGLLVVEETQPVITIDSENNLKVSQSCRLALKDKEYISNLESERDRYKTELEFYGDEKNYLRNFDADSKVVYDKGTKAREALGEK